MNNNKIKKVSVVVNPVSANGKTGKNWPEIASWLKVEGIDFDYWLTEGPGKATEITRRALQQGSQLVIAVGGDGTANEVINGFFTPAGLVSETAAVGFIPSGTGNDLSDTLHIPRNYREAIKHLIASPPRRLDLGRVRFTGHDGNFYSRYFVNVAGLGLDGETVARVNRTSKALGGFVSFLWGTVITLLLYRNRQMAISVDGELVFEGPVTTVVAGNGRYIGGGMCIAPGAVMDDGLLDIVIVHNMSKPELLVSLPRVYRGSHLSHPRVKSLNGRKVIITAPGATLLNLDGEQPGRAPIEIEILPGVLTVKG
ncbi:MAG: diacylglycerol kinase family lipid kinase [Firmicutes bacterium]|nr:diacylglycerol kinase family lipid kinase [Bacillota bacterium]